MNYPELLERKIGSPQSRLSGCDRMSPRMSWEEDGSVRRVEWDSTTYWMVQMDRRTGLYGQRRVVAKTISQMEFETCLCQQK